MNLSPLYGKDGNGASRSTERSIRLVAAPNFSLTKGQIKERYKKEQGRDAQLNYSATEPSQFRRTRHNLYGQGDAHYAQEYRFSELREYARDMDRNDVFVGQLFDKACDNILGTGLIPHPSTGDEGLNEAIRDRWIVWANDPRLCDFSMRHTFSRIERLTLRHRFIDGDFFNIPREGEIDGQANVALQYYEGDRVESPDNVNDDTVHGVKLDPLNDRVLGYYFITPRPGTRKQRIRRLPVSINSPDVKFVPAWGGVWRNVYHIYDPKRVTMNRGVSALAPCFDYVGMFEDINFARLVQQQVVSSIAAFITSERNFQFGAQTNYNEPDGSTTVSEEIVPGSQVRLRPGEDVKAFTSGVPDPEFHAHVNLIVRLIGGCIGLPLEMAMMDTTNTTFHGYRGVLQMARRTSSRIHADLTSQLHRPLYNRLVRAWFPERIGDPLLFRHQWQMPGFMYVDPKVEAEADKIRSKNMLTSPRRLHAEQGNSWDDISQEIVEDNTAIIKRAIEAANKLNEQADEHDQVTWRDILNLDAPTGVTRQVKQAIEDPEAIKAQKETDSSKKLATLSNELVRLEDRLSARLDVVRAPVMNLNIPERQVSITNDVDARTSLAEGSVVISEGAVQVTAPVDARTSIAEGAVQVTTPVDARTSIAEGAVKLDVDVDVKGGDKKITIARDSKDRISSAEVKEQ